MLSRNGEGVLLIGVLLAVGAVSWWLMLRPFVEYDPTRFDRLPSEINGWRAIDLEMDEAVSEMLAADHNVQRAYFHDQGYAVFVYIGYYGTARGGTPEHTPDVCYPAQGWEVVEAGAQSIGGAKGLAVQELLVEKAGERRLVHFWYRTSHSTGIASVLGLRMQHFWGRIARNRGDGALIRLSTRVDGDVSGARSRLLGMVVAVEAELDRLFEGGSEVPPGPQAESAI